LRHLAFVCLVFFLSVADARASQIDVGGAKLAFAPPKGHCELDRKVPSDAAYLDAMAGAMGTETRILAAFAACDQLAVWRKGLLTFFRDYGFLTVARSDERRQLGEARPAIMRALARELRKADAEGDAGPDGPQARELGRIDHLGVLHSDDDAVYYGMVTEVATPEGRVRESVELGAMTLIKGKLVSYLLYGEFAGRPSVDKLLGRQRTNMDRLIAAN
jgi:hypothetical protein